MADAHLKRQVIGREVVVAVTNGCLDGFAEAPPEPAEGVAGIFGAWEWIFYREFDGRRRKWVLVKIVGG